LKSNNKSIQEIELINISKEFDSDSHKNNSSKKEKDINFNNLKTASPLLEEFSKEKINEEDDAPYYDNNENITENNIKLEKLSFVDFFIIIFILNAVKKIIIRK